MERVNWNDVQEFFRKLKDRKGKKFRLAVESEWEYAVHASMMAARYWGGEIGSNNANCHG